MNSESTKPQGTRRRRSPSPPFIFHVAPDLFDSVTSPTTDHVASSPHYTLPTARSIHQSGDHASVTIQGSYFDVGGDQNFNTYIDTYFGGKLYLTKSKKFNAVCCSL